MKILIVDDHAVVLEAMALMLARLIPGAEPVTARDEGEAMRLAAARPFDVVLLDLFMPGVGGVEALAAFRSGHPALPVIVLSSSLDPEDARRALSAGAQGYVPKSADPKTLAGAIRMVLDGDVYVPPLLLSRAPPSAAEEPHAAELTSRQADVLRLLAGGSSNKEIGLRLGLSEKTVKVHVGAIFRRLGVTRRMHAAEWARRSSLV